MIIMNCIIYKSYCMKNSIVINAFADKLGFIYFSSTDLEQTNLFLLSIPTSFQRPLSQPRISTPSSPSPLGLGSPGCQFVYNISDLSTVTNIPSCSISFMPIQICSLGMRLAIKSFSASDLGIARKEPSDLHWLSASRKLFAGYIL